MASKRLPLSGRGPSCTAPYFTLKTLPNIRPLVLTTYLRPRPFARPSSIPSHSSFSTYRRSSGSARLCMAGGEDAVAARDGTSVPPSSEDETASYSKSPFGLGPRTPRRSSSGATLSPVLKRLQLGEPSQDEMPTSSSPTSRKGSSSLSARDSTAITAALSEAISDEMPQQENSDVGESANGSGVTRPPTALLSYPSSPSSPTYARESSSARSSPRNDRLQPSPVAIEAPPSPTTAHTSGFSAEVNGAHILPSAGDGVFIRRPGQAWQPQPHSDMQQYRMIKHELPQASARAYGSFSRASGASAAAASLSGLLSESQQSQQLQPQAQPKGSSNDADEPASEDSALTATFTSLWDRLTKFAAAPDADGVVRPGSSQAVQSDETPTTPTTSSTTAATPADSFYSAIDTLRRSLGIKDSEEEDWMNRMRPEIDHVVQSAESGERAAKQGQGLEIDRGEHGRKSIPPSPLRIQDRWETPKLPICFSHGLFGFDTINVMPSVTISYWRGVVEALEANGCEVLVCRVPTSASIQERAAALKAQIEERFKGREINIVAHSMGGLDSRYMISQLRPTFSVRSLTTITTPHKGSSFADFMLYDVIGRERLPKLLSMLKAINLPGGGRAFENLTVDAMAEFNKRVPDNPNTKYFSWGAEFTPSVFNEFRIPHGIIYKKEGANDGLVSVESSQWGQFQGSLQNVNHLQIVGWRTGGAITKLAFGQDSVFNATNFYLQICEDLAKEGF